jgi:hypothetical protein
LAEDQENAHGLDQIVHAVRDLDAAAECARGVDPLSPARHGLGE